MRSDKGKTHKYPKKRKPPRPYKVKSHTRGGPLALGDLWDADKGGDVWGKKKEKKK